MKTIANLKSELREKFSKDEFNLQWFISYKVAEDYSDMSTKDWARMIYHGEQISSVETEEDISEQIYLMYIDEGQVENYSDMDFSEYQIPEQHYQEVLETISQEITNFLK